MYWWLYVHVFEVTRIDEEKKVMDEMGAVEAEKRDEQ